MSGLGPHADTNAGFRVRYRRCFSRTHQLRRAARVEVVPRSGSTLGLNSSTINTTNTEGKAKCGLKNCPSGKNPTFTCDVFDDLGPGRINTLMQPYKKEHRAAVDEARKKEGRPPIDEKQAAADGWNRRQGPPKTNSHVLTPPSDEENEEPASLEDVLSEMTARWHTNIVTDGITDDM